ncbi:MAG TPA: hypothetical protein VJ944_05520 [Thermoplasmataceae archaeon]|nr:hypothetical protein [Thermoplasmataceae archaeon]
MRRALIETLAIFVTSLSVRLLIFYPTFIQGGDLGQFATFVREIHIAGWIPAANVLYFPGTAYIYPPLLFLIVNSLNALFHPAFAPHLVMAELLAVAATASSLTASIIYYAARNNKSALKNLIIGAVAVFFMPDLYGLSWGGDPFIFGEFLFIALLYTLSKRSISGWTWILWSSIAAVLLALSHDLTWFFSMLAFLVLLIYDATRKDLNLILRELMPFFSALVVGLIWWLPRIRFVYDAFFVTESSGYGSYIPLSTAGSYLMVFIPFALSVIAIAFYTLYKSDIRLSKVKWDPFIIALVASLIFIPFIFKSTTLGGRIMYYTIILGTIVVLRLFSATSGPVLKRVATGKGRNSASRLAIAILLGVVLVAVPFQAGIAAGSVSHYKSGYYQYDAQLLAWGEKNLSNGIVIAPNIGNYISSVDGVPVIVYGNFLVGGSQIDLRNAATYIVMNPANQTSANYIHEYGIKYIVVTQEFLASQASSGYFPSGMYKEVFSDKYYVVEQYTGG